MIARDSFKLSIIVPIYNVEKYLRQCIDSLLAQTLDNIELVLVDDGSPDECGHIADEYSSRYANIKCLHQKNCGLGPARNAGIEVAAGEYIGFVDSDDWVYPWMFERLYAQAKKEDADIVASGFEEWTDGKLIKRNMHPFAGETLRDVNEIDLLRKSLYGRTPKDSCTFPYPVSVCCSIYRRRLLDGGYIRFHEVLSEDVFFNLDIYRHAAVISCTADCGYCYRKDCQDSITRSFSIKKADRYASFFALLAKYAAEEDDVEDCLLRARRKMVDYTRSYVFMVEKSGLPLDEKIRSIRALTDKKVFKSYCADYPSRELPKFQSMFHRLLVSGHERTALTLTRVRMLTRGEK